MKLIKSKIKSKRGITLIALVVTIIVLMILTGISISMLTGNNGIITRAIEAQFRTEMTEIKEKVRMSVVNSKISSESITTIFADKDKVKIKDAKEWDDQLKLEVIYWGEYEIGVSELTRSYVKKNWQSILNGEDEDYIDNLYYVSKDIAGEENKYLYDTNVDIVYKIKTTTIGKYKVNSIEDLDYQMRNENTARKTTGTTITSESKIITVGNEAFYEPDLNGFIMEKTKLIYYNIEDDEDILEVDPSQYLPGGNSRTITKDSKTYEFYDYCKNSSNQNNSKWANIKVKNSGVETWWVWIPRYAYKINGTATDIIFIDLENKNATTGEDLPSGYIVHPSFNEGLKGIWVSKYEPSMIATTEVDEIPFYMPDMTGFDAENTYIEVYDGENGFTETKLADIKDLTKFAKNNKWYDYYSQVWANIKVEKDGMETWWVWIPRYAYNITGTSTSIIFVDTNNKPISGEDLPSNYVVHPAFGNDLRGIWVSKYEPSQTIGERDMTNNVNIPDLSGFDAENTYLEVYNNDGSFTDVKLSTITNLETFIQNNNWYDYSKKLWANIKVVKNGLETWWVWIPKYAYNITGIETSVIFLNADGTTKDGTALPSNYVPHPAFNNGLSGIWASKYEPSGEIN